MGRASRNRAERRAARGRPFITFDELIGSAFANDLQGRRDAAALARLRRPVRYAVRNALGVPAYPAPYLETASQWAERLPPVDWTAPTTCTAWENTEPVPVEQVYADIKRAYDELKAQTGTVPTQVEFGHVCDPMRWPEPLERAPAGALRPLEYYIGP